MGDSSSFGAEATLQRMAASRAPLQRLFYPSLESEVVGVYMASRRRHFDDDKWAALVYGLHTSRTLYVGNLSFSTREEQLHELFARVAPVRRVIMGLNAQTRTPCGFAFVEMMDHDAALAATGLLNASKLDDRALKAELDAAFEEGRQYGRGRSGGQIADDTRADFDAGRGGWGTLQQARQERREAAEQFRKAQMDQFGAGKEGEDEPYEEPDVETYGGGWDRSQSSNSAFADQRPLKLSQSSLAACLPGVFPHYALPLDDKVKEAIATHLAEAKVELSPAAAAAIGLPPPGDAAAFASKRSLSPDSAAAGTAAASSPHPRSPSAKRARHSPAHIDSSRSPQPLPPSAAAAASHPSSPQPRERSPQHMDLGDDDHTPPPSDREDDYDRYDDYDDDRTPPPRELSDDDRTPPPSPPRDHGDEDDDRTPQRLSPQPLQRARSPDDGSMADDAETPPPASQDSHGFRKEGEGGDLHQPDFAAFER